MVWKFKRFLSSLLLFHLLQIFSRLQNFSLWKKGNGIKIGNRRKKMNESSCMIFFKWQENSNSQASQGPLKIVLELVNSRLF